jgi:hypothetical protein
MTIPAPGEVADILAIQRLIAAYPGDVDALEFVGLDDLCTPDAVIDFSAFGGPVDGLPGIKKFLRESMALFKRTQHMMGLPDITLDGDRATARTSCTNPMVIAVDDGTSSVMLIGLWYDDEFVRTPDGWRFTSRKQERCYSVVGLTDTPIGPA